MDPLLLAAEWWWVAPTAVAAGTVGVMGLRRHSSTSSGRRLAVDAARHDLREAQLIAAERRTALKIARADLARVSAERAAHRASAEQVAGARRMLRGRERDAKAASADVRARQVRLNAARAAVPSASEPRPLERLHAAHDAVTTRWMRYETDPALQIAFPAMTDVKNPATATYFRAAGHAAEMRREATGRITPSEFAAYRDAVAELERAFEAAEYAAKVHAGEVPPNAAWQDAAQDMLNRSAEAIDRAAGAAAAALSSWTSRGRKGPPPDQQR
ncbi:hypothetical protein [Microbacterium oxydans]|uniref:hypothetical protein n=1 Tax=Microbacterium oxydans TaxID=82380 RepID=UPI0022B1B37A|nr:hypothetical protein [Microbacterium oxydans]MCZ4299649.1 hypothetical protein [Microbacterium oxydans]